MKAQVEVLTVWSTVRAVGTLVLGIAITGSVASGQPDNPFPPAELVSVRADGGIANGASNGGVLSSDGRCVAYYSDASNLLPQGPSADTNQFTDVYLFDRDTRQVERISVGIDGQQPNGPSMAQRFRPAIDAGCTCVAFSSDASNLVPGDTNRTTDVFVRDISADPPFTQMVSIGEGGEPADGASSFPSVSADCQLASFHSVASNLVPGDTNNASDVFVYNRATGTTTRVSVGPGGVQANGPSITPAMSADGRCVAFASGATNLMAQPDTNRTLDIYVACDGEVVCRASVSSDGQEANGMSMLPALNADGTIVAFKSEASNLVPGDTNGQPDVFVHNCVTGETERVSVSTAGV